MPVIIRWTNLNSICEDEMLKTYLLPEDHHIIVSARIIGNVTGFEGDDDSYENKDYRDAVTKFHNFFDSEDCKEFFTSENILSLCRNESVTEVIERFKFCG